MAYGIGSRGSLPLPSVPGVHTHTATWQPPCSQTWPTHHAQVEGGGLVHLPNTTLHIQRLDVEDACDITDAVLDAPMPPVAGAGVQQHAGVTGSAV